MAGSLALSEIERTRSQKLAELVVLYDQLMVWEAEPYCQKMAAEQDKLWQLTHGLNDLMAGATMKDPATWPDGVGALALRIYCTMDYIVPLMAKRDRQVLHVMKMASFAGITVARQRMMEEFFEMRDRRHVKVTKAVRSVAKEAARQRLITEFFHAQYVGWAPVPVRTTASGYTQGVVA